MERPTRARVSREAARSCIALLAELNYGSAAVGGNREWASLPGTAVASGPADRERAVARSNANGTGAAVSSIRSRARATGGGTPRKPCHLAQPSSQFRYPLAPTGTPGDTPRKRTGSRAFLYKVFKTITEPSLAGPYASSGLQAFYGAICYGILWV